MVEAEVAVVGAGPAGLCASIEAAKAGAEVVLLDENSRPGGQLFKQIHKFFGSDLHGAGKRGFEIGNELLEEVERVGVEISLETTVFGVFEDSVIGVLKNGKTQRLKSKAMVLATGACENSIVFPGWTLPGVMSAGAAQTMVNVHRVLPGMQILVIGAGNVGLIVSYQLLQAGADVVAVVEAKKEIGGYGVHSAKIKRAGIPILTSHTIKQALGEREVESAVLIELDQNGCLLPGSEKALNVDVICLAVGLSPLAELAWVTGCDFVFLPELGGHVPVHSANMETSQKGVYVAGDVAGVEEASTAMEEGKLAGISAAETLGCIDPSDASSTKKEIRRRLSSLRRGPFGESREEALRKMSRIARKKHDCQDPAEGW